MNIFTRANGRISDPGWIAAALLMLSFTTGCGQNDVKVYRVAKETPTAIPQKAPMSAGNEQAGGAQSPLRWKLPAGWEEVSPGEMRVASFRVKGDGGKQADVSVIPLPADLPGMAGDLSNVNRWRGQLGLAAVSEADLSKLAEPVVVAGESSKLYDQAGKNPGSGDPTRILAAVSRREGMAWFFKMTGDDDLVVAQKPAFVEFLKSLTFTAATAQPELPPSHPPIDAAAIAAAKQGSLASQLPPSHPPIAGAAQTAPASGSNDGKPAWKVPAGWTEVAGGQFLVAKFLVTGPENTQAAINVSMSVNDGGGLLANANRWRGQLGLAPLAQSDLEKQTQTLELSDGKATLLDMSGTDARTGQKARLIAAVVPQSGQTWFYKLMGNEQLVEREKAAFTTFVQSAKY